MRDLENQVVQQKPMCAALTNCPQKRRTMEVRHTGRRVGLSFNAARLHVNEGVDYSI